MSEPTCRSLEPADADWARDLVIRNWGAGFIITRGRRHDVADLQGVVAERDGSRVGLALYHVQGDECELVSLDSLVGGVGVGSGLVDAVAGRARAAGCERLWLITTNDNLRAPRFYQRRGFRLEALYPGAVTESRRLKPSIPILGYDGIPIRDEIELALAL